MQMLGSRPAWALHSCQCLPRHGQGSLPTHRLPQNDPVQHRDTLVSDVPTRPLHSRVHTILTQATSNPSKMTSGQGERLERQFSTHKWLWRGHKISYLTAGCGQPVLLVHGFGASALHFRKNIEVLAKTYKVYAIDKLGFGSSDKPCMEYTMELWRDMVVDFMAEFIQQPAVLVGNSIGSLTCLMVAAQAPEAVKGLALLNCTGAMNNKGITNDWRIWLAYPIIMLIDMCLKTRSIAEPMFNSFRSRGNVRNVLESVYCNKAAVDDALVDLIIGPSGDPGALDVFVSVITGPPGPRPWDLIPDVKAPMLVLWGDSDPFTPADSPVALYFRQLPLGRPATKFKILTDVGHCPHDDRPEHVHAELLPWLQQLEQGMVGTPCEEEKAIELAQGEAGGAVAGETGEVSEPAAQPMPPSMPQGLPA